MNRHTICRRRASSAGRCALNFVGSRRPNAVPRRGVILLMVLALLSLFLLIGMTLVMISGQARRSARSAARAEKRLADAPESLLDAAMLQVIAGTNNSASVLRPHSLLEDMYGMDGVPGTISQLHTGDVFSGNGYLGEFKKDLSTAINVNNQALGEFLCLTFNEFGGDTAPGVAGVDDDGNSTTDGTLMPFPMPAMGPPPNFDLYEVDWSEVGWPGSDDTIVGLDGKPGVAGFDDNGNGVIDEGGLYDTANPASGGEVLAPGSDDCRLTMVHNYYAGRVITMTSGIAAGQSARIVASIVRTPPHVPATNRPPLVTLVVRRFSGVPTPTTPGVQVGLQPGDTFVINGAPFNGTGFGLSLAQLQNYDLTGAAGPAFVLGAYEYDAAPGTLPDPPQSGDVYNTGVWPFALLPNPAAFSASRILLGAAGTFPAPYLDPAGPGGADEDYDAVDYQNMLLAMRRNLPDTSGNFRYASPVVEIPSLHRPDLVRYWFQRLSDTITANPTAYGLGSTPSPDDIAQLILRADLSGASNDGRKQVLYLKHKFLLRPLLEDHPNFAVNNPAALNAGVNGTNFLSNSWEITGVPGGSIVVGASNPQWDVDNDNDGIGDSIWVDLGFPVQQTADGKLYKPLAAILCVDMDGKLNLNAHGNPNQTPVFATAVSPPGYVPPTLLGPLAHSPTGTSPISNTMAVFPGSGAAGYGPADVHLGGVMSIYGRDGDFDTADDVRTFGYDGRPGRAYVDDDMDGIVDNDAELGAAGSDDGFVWGPDNQPGIAGFDDNGNGLIDDAGELGWLGSDDWYEAGRLFWGWVNYQNFQQRLDGRYGEVWRSFPPLAGLQGVAPAPGVPAVMQNVSIAGFPDAEKPWNDFEAADLLRYPDMPYFFKKDAWSSGAYPPIANPSATVNAPGFDGGDDDFDGRNDNVFQNTAGGVTYYVPDLGETSTRGSNDNVWTASTYGSPPDLDGDGFVMLDLRGLPMFMGTSSNHGVGEAGERWDDPYELDLSPSAPRAGLRDPNGQTYTRDNPFHPGELEPLLRANDLDVGALPGRLALLAPTLAADPWLRNLVTTDSWDLPGPSVVAMPDFQINETMVATELRTYRFDTAPLVAGDNIQFARPGAAHVADMLRNRILREHDSATPAVVINTISNRLIGPTLDYMTNQLGQHLGYDLMANLKLDLNAPFGNGRDSGNAPNGVVDEFSEALEIADNADNDGNSDTDLPNAAIAFRGEGEIAWSDPGRAATTPQSGVSMDLNRDGVLAAEEALARYEMAKKLYLLLSLLTPKHFQVNLSSAAPDTDEVETARWLAQWAVNIVDYRDADSIMTPFEYDIRPFLDEGTVDPPYPAGPNTPNPASAFDGDPWDVDGWVGQAPGTDRIFGTLDLGEGASPDDAATYRGLVWGCERPALLITETLAYHDRRIEDDATVGGGTVDGGTDTNNNFDQLDMPKGVFAFELFNPWPTDASRPQNGSVATPPVELSNSSPLTGEYGIQLDRRAGPALGGGTALTDAPVWRLVVAPADVNLSILDNPILNTGAPFAADSFRFIYFVEPDTATDYGDVGARFVRYFAGSNTGSPVDQNDPDNRPMVVAPRRYAVVVPANQTPGEGRQEMNVGEFNGTEFALTWNLDPAESVAVPVNPITAVDAMGAEQRPWTSAGLVWSEQVQRPMVFQINCSSTAAEPDGVRHTSTGVYTSMNVSEPIDGYSSMLPQDIPLDSSLVTNPDFPVALSGSNGTADGFRVLLLQRLANPLVNYDASSNPYLTVDALPISLTAYRGKPTATTSGWERINVTTLDSVQRGANAQASLWQQGFNTPTALAATSTDTAPLRGSTLGFANYTYTPDDTPPPQGMPGFAGDRFAARYVNQVVGGNSQLPYQLANLTDAIPPPNGSNSIPNVLETSGIPASEYIGEVRLDALAATPPTPGWLQWPNRPYVSGHEIMQVPALSPSRLLAAPVNYAAGVEPRRGFTYAGAVDEYTSNDDNMQGIVFGHLQDVFDQYGRSFVSDANMMMPSPERPPMFHRILDYVGVPSRFAGTQSSLSASLGYFQAPTLALTSATNPMPFPFCAPFNLVNEYREPGKINLNTVFDPIVFRGLVGDVTAQGYEMTTGLTNSPGNNDNWQRFWESRRGYNPTDAGGVNVAVTAGAGELNSISPTFFAQPFRAAGAQMHVPLDILTHPSLNVGAARQEVSANLLRGVLVAGAPTDPLFINADENLFRHTDSNPAFRYELLQKLGNVATTRSNVYAVWITIGRFEVERAPPESYPWYSPSEFQQVFPDGYRLGKEVGLDEGSVERQRAFYMFDRTIPMGFQRGEKLNTDNGILLRRIIQ